MHRRWLRIVILIAMVLAAGLVALVVIVAVGAHVPSPQRAFFPFAPDTRCVIAIIDDTDGFQFATTAPVYDLIDELGLRVTKTIWVYDDPSGGRRSRPERQGISLVNPPYRRWVLREWRRGHEITLHSATSGDDEREVMLAAYDTVRTVFGRFPRLEVFHSNNKEALYWGSKRLPSPILRSLYERKISDRFEGDEPGSPYYWADASRGRVSYVRTYTFTEIDTWAINPTMPFEDARTPDAPLWFASSNARMGDEFVALFAPEHIEKLKRQGGASLVYTHFAANFTVPAGSRWEVRSDVRETLTRCGQDPEIEFAPGGDVLDRLRLIQMIEDGLRDGARTLELPEVLRPALAHLSVRPSRVVGVPDTYAGEGVEPVAVTSWLDDAGVEIRWTDRSIFDGARSISDRERWRLVLQWLLTQIRTPT